MKRYTFVILTMLTVSLLLGCSLGSNVTKGSVIMRTASEAHINLGGDDGLQVGDTLTVWRDERYAGRTTRTVRVGKVRVVRLLDERHSVVEVLTGTLQERDTVEKKIR